MLLHGAELLRFRLGTRESLHPKGDVVADGRPRPILQGNVIPQRYPGTYSAPCVGSRAN